MRVLAAVALAGAVALAFWLWLDPLPGFYLYNVPIAVPFVLFLDERWRLHRWRASARLGLDLSVVALALSRALVHVPYVSGHVLFLAYAALTAQSRRVRILSGLVLLQVLYMKVAVFGDGITPLGGLVVSMLAKALWELADDRVKST